MKNIYLITFLLSSTAIAQTPAVAPAPRVAPAVNRPAPAPEPVAAPVDPVPVPSEGERLLKENSTPALAEATVAKSIKPESTPKEKISQVDSLIATIAPAPNSHVSPLLKTLIRIRAQECAKDRVACLSSIEWAQRACVESTRLETLQEIYQTKIQNLNSDEEALGVWGEVDKCALSVKYPMPEFRSQIFEVAIKKNWKKTTAIANQWGSKLLTSPENKTTAAKWIGFISGRLGNLEASTPIKLGELSGIFEPTISWMEKNSALLTVEERLSWSSVVKDLHFFRGDMGRVLKAINVVRKDLTQPEAKNLVPTHIFSACSAYRYLGQFSKCLEFMVPFETTYDLVVSHQKATTLYETGDLKKALESYQAYAAKYSDDLLAQKWATLTIAQLKFYLGDNSGSAQAFSAYEKVLAKNPPYWFDSLHTNMVQLRFARSKNQFPEAWEIVQRQKALVAKHFLGKSLEGNKILFEAFLTAVREKNKVKMAQTRKDLETVFAGLSPGDFYRVATMYVDRKIANEKADLEEAALLKLRPKSNFEYITIQSALSGKN